MKSFVAAIVITVLLTLPASAAHWTVDYTRSKLGFTANWSNEPFSAAFKSWKADINFDPADLPHARADVTVDLGSEASDEADFDDGLKGAEGFQIVQFPSAHFAATHFVHKAGDLFVATGQLSIRGVAKDVVLPFSLDIQGNRAHMKGTANVVRTDYGVGQGAWAAPTPVAHNVAVTIDLYAERAN
jgi:polyisoprenoid-binding protein YceI